MMNKSPRINTQVRRRIDLLIEYAVNNGWSKKEIVDEIELMWDEIEAATLGEEKNEQ